MKATKAKPVTDTSSEEKIKNAARIVFHNKGFAATRTRDIAEEAGINLALLNYYFRSKEKLFNIIMLESLHDFFKSLGEVFYNDQTTLEKKIEELVGRYIDALIENPNIPLFLLSELRNSPEDFVSKIGMKEMIMKSFFMKQLQQGIQAGKIIKVHPLHIMANLMSMIIFPFVASPVIKGMGDFSQKDFEKMMLERKVLIPKWVKAILKAK